MSTPNPFPDIPVTVAQIIRQAGHKAYQRGLAYARQREVVRYTYDEDENTLEGLVNGSTPIPYEVDIRFFPGSDADSNLFNARCTCPVTADCKHAVALMLTALDRAKTARKALDNAPGGRIRQSMNPENPEDTARQVAEATDDPLAALRASGAIRSASSLTTEPASLPLNNHENTHSSPSKISVWRRDMAQVLAARGEASGIDSARVPGALDLSFSISGSYARGRNIPGATPPINLLARPLMQSKTGRWIKGGLSWETFASSVGGPVGRHEVYPEHERFFAEIYAIARPWQNMYSSHRDWISLTATNSTLLWDVLARAEQIGLPILLEGFEVTTAVLPPAQVRVHAGAVEAESRQSAETAVSEDSAPDLALHAALGWETREDNRVRQLWFDAAHCHPIGSPRSGFFALGSLVQRIYEEQAHRVHWKSTRKGALDAPHRDVFQTQSSQQAEESSDESENSETQTGGLIPELSPENVATPTIPDLPEGLNLAFIPLAEPLDAAAESLVSRGEMRIPADEREAFHREFLPTLTRAVPFFTPDPALALPKVHSPYLVFEAHFDDEISHDALLNWYWEYPKNPLDEEGTDSGVRRLPALGLGTERDERFEARVLRAVRSATASNPVLAGGFGERRSQGWETRDILAHVLPTLRRIPGVRVRLLGSVPEFTEATDAMIEVKVTEGNSRDWFGLGIAIKVNNWTVPFAQVFEALDRNQDRILLGNGTYFSLNRPEFSALRTLIEEARTLNETGGELRINRHQAGLFSELESLASSVETVASWDAQVKSLLALVEAADRAGETADSEEVLENEHSDSLSVSSGVFSANHLSSPPGLTAVLRPYQLEGFRWLAFLRQHRLGGILADDMGLGKTVQVLALLAQAIVEHEQRADHTDFAPFLVVAPTSVVGNWAQEAARFVPDAKVVTITESTSKSGTSIAELVQGAHLVLTSYALFRLDEDGYTEFGDHVPESAENGASPRAGWGALILDEAQFVKNTKTRAWKVARALNAQVKLAITGTPMENNLMELWALLAIVADGLFPSARIFRDLYARPAESGEDPQVIEKLRRRVHPLMLRRTKDVVAADLPEKNDVRVNVPLTTAHRHIYDMHLQRERQKVLGLLDDMDKNRFTIFQSLTLLRRLALDATLIDPDEYAGVASAKLEYLVEHLPSLLGDRHRVLVFSQFTGYLRTIAERLQAEGIDYLYLDGTTRNRPQVLKDFAEGAAPVFLISLKAGGFGLNLTEADHCFIMDPWWNPAAEQQAVDRIHRLGQERDVHVYRLVAEGTIEEKVMDLKASKAALFDAVVNDGSFASSRVDAEQIRELFTPTDS
ncbi:SNF2-related protein [Rothia dentocariosa]|uniref:DEAD/DEAH box helicase n=1 Tax=Rothia dentocariosa TaxID=2047 RepID=UPI003C7BBDD3